MTLAQSQKKEEEKQLFFDEKQYMYLLDPIHVPRGSRWHFTVLEESERQQFFLRFSLFASLGCVPVSQGCDRTDVQRLKQAEDPRLLVCEYLLWEGFESFNQVSRDVLFGRASCVECFSLLYSTLLEGVRFCRGR